MTKAQEILEKICDINGDDNHTFVSVNPHKLAQYLAEITLDV